MVQPIGPLALRIGRYNSRNLWNIVVRCRSTIDVDFNARPGLRAALKGQLCRGCGVVQRHTRVIRQAHDDGRFNPCKINSHADSICGHNRPEIAICIKADSDQGIAAMTQFGVVVIKPDCPSSIGGRNGAGDKRARCKIINTKRHIRAGAYSRYRWVGYCERIGRSDRRAI